MKKLFILYLLIFAACFQLNAQTPYQKIDSICKIINELEKTSEGHVFADVTKQEYLLSVPETSFQVFINNRLATKVASAEINGKQVLEITVGVDLSQVLSISGVMAGKDLVEVRLHFPKRSLNVQMYEEGEYKKSMKTDYLGFLVSSKTSKGAQNVYKMMQSVSSLSSMFIKEKGLADKIGEQWENYSLKLLEAFLDHHRTNPGSVFLMDGLNLSKNLLNESFSDNRNNWLQSENSEHLLKTVDGVYKIYSKTSGAWFSTIPIQNSIETGQDFDISVTLKKLSGTDEYYFGILIGFDAETRHHHLVALKGNGQYVLANKGTHPKDIIQSRSNIVNKGNAINVIRLQKVKGQFRLYINNQLAGTTEASELYGNRFGFQVWSNMEGLDIEAENFIISVS